DYGEITILYGTTEPAMRLFTDELTEWRDRDDIEFHETVDEADEDWDGNEGVITTLMPDIDVDKEETVTAVCGPPVMYKFVMLELIEMDMPHENIYLSLERNMKCGVGKCGHCQINGVYVCQDGPVFCYEEVEGLEEAIR
ncbi:MAG: oxidoreductase, partial [Planctomycetota bacterium]